MKVGRTQTARATKRALASRQPQVVMRRPPCTVFMYTSWSATAPLLICYPISHSLFSYNVVKRWCAVANRRACNSVCTYIKCGFRFIIPDLRRVLVGTPGTKGAGNKTHISTQVFCADLKNGTTCDGIVCGLLALSNAHQVTRQPKRHASFLLPLATGLARSPSMAAGL